MKIQKKKIFTYMLFMATAFSLQGCGFQSGSVVKDADARICPCMSQSMDICEPVLDSGDSGEEASGAVSENQEDRIKDTLASMSRREKVGQLFVVAFRGSETVEIGEDIIRFMKDYPIGGVVLFSENIKTEVQVKKYIEDLQNLSKIPLFIAVDEEGGRVVRTKSLHLPSIPSPGEIGKTGDLEAAYGYGGTIGGYLKALGFNMDFAPSADVFSNPRNTVIGDRSFGDDPKLVGEMAGAFIYGLQDNGILSVAKHFPGHGNTSEDSHFGRAVNAGTLEEIKETELPPFQMAIDAHVTGIMVSHISTPNAAGNDEPATFSSFWLKDILREEMGFEGIIITDALDMGAVTQYDSPGEAAVKAFKAGADILLMPENPQEAFNALLSAVESGEVSEERLDDSIRRILKSKLLK